MWEFVREANRARGCGLLLWPPSSVANGVIRARPVESQQRRLRATCSNTSVTSLMKAVAAEDRFLRSSWRSPRAHQPSADFLNTARHTAGVIALHSALHFIPNCWFDSLAAHHPFISPVGRRRSRKVVPLWRCLLISVCTRFLPEEAGRRSRCLQSEPRGTHRFDARGRIRSANAGLPSPLSARR